MIHGGLAEGQYYSKDVEVWTSANGTDFTLAGSGVLVDEPLNSISIPLGSVTAQKVKLSITSGYRTDWWELAEFEVYGEIGGCSTCGDLDGSGGNVDAVDFGLFAACCGENPSINPSCACANLVEFDDDIIDLLDFSVFAELFLSSSSNYPPNCSAP